MRPYALAAPLALWLILAAPFYCHHGLTTAWSDPQHVHQADSMAHAAANHGDAGMTASDSAPAFCPHQNSDSTAALAFVTLDTLAEPACNHTIPDLAGGRPALTGSYPPHSTTPAPLERPPSASA